MDTKSQIEILISKCDFFHYEGIQDMVVSIVELIKISRSEGFSDGYDSGYDSGYSVGYDSGYDSGYLDGHLNIDRNI